MIDRGRLVEDGAPAQIFGGARTERARAFVGKISRH
jgi:ABC-type histidine transport system ATPase subunit